MSLTFDCVSVADGRQPAGFASFTGHSPDGLRRSANKVSAISLAHRLVNPKNKCGWASFLASEQVHLGVVRPIRIPRT